MTDKGKTKAQRTDEAGEALQRAAAELAEWKSRYEAAVQATGQVLYDWNSQTDAVLWGGNTEQLLGYALDELPGTLAQVMALVHPADRAAFEQEIVRARTTKSGFHLTYRLRRKDGAYITVEDQGHFFVDRAGTVVRMVGFLVDIAERLQAEEALRESEARYRNLFENANDAIVTFTLEGIVTSVNRGLEAMLGWAREELLGQHYRKFVPPDSVRQGEARTRRFLAGERPPSIFEAAMGCKDGRVVPVEVRTRAIRDSAGKPIGFQGIYRDLTVRKRAEGALQQAKEAAEAANRAKSEFLATMSHELRTPLGVILGYTELLLEDTFGRLGEQQADSLRRIDRSARELHELIAAVLDLSRLEAGRLPLSLHATQVVALLQELQIETQSLQEQGRLQFLWNVEQPLPMLHTDAGKLKVVLKNLIGNAVKFTKEGSITVAARSWNGGVELRVSDTGMGIPQEALAVIFEPFRQLESSATRQYGGTGLGLHIVKRLLEMLGGTITVASEVGRGSTFRVWLPQGR
ncbi:MAG TPA: PAS domain S-box protein [Candidatus Binatia bacterium]|nr:PAS domain S-box protein [Candidatus Binatia bacterium]